MVNHETKETLKKITVVSYGRPYFREKTTV
jgi:hypothetical protein